MPVQTNQASQERLDLIQNAFFPRYQDGYDDGFDPCDCEFCAVDPDFADTDDPAEAIAQATFDGTLQALESLICISKSGADADALAASKALLDFQLSLTALATVE